MIEGIKKQMCVAFISMEAIQSVITEASLFIDFLSLFRKLASQVIEVFLVLCMVCVLTLVFFFYLFWGWEESVLFSPFFRKDTEQNSRSCQENFFSFVSSIK